MAHATMQNEMDVKLKTQECSLKPKSLSPQQSSHVLYQQTYDFQ